MLYLMFTQDGFIKKYPLQKDSVIIGRDSGCDLIVPENFVSMRHASIIRKRDEVEIQDLGSKNGIWIDQFRIENARLHVNDSFRIGHLEFYLHEGETDDFVVSQEIKSLLSRVNRVQEKDHEETREGVNLIERSLFFTLQLGFKGTSLENIFKKTRVPLQSILKEGALFLVKESKNYVKTLASLKLNPDMEIDIHELAVRKNLMTKEATLIDGEWLIHTNPIRMNDVSAALVYCRKAAGREAISKKISTFLKDFSREISLIDLLSVHKKGPSPYDGQKGMEIITQDPEMVNLLEKCQCIASSEISIMIQGETGTGKELFAHFIHNQSARKNHKYIGINCSTIPENLLEDELFGHEKGAFTGAHEKREGKLELASGGTLVLDEIGDMPLSLQAKLLRVLQEREFYRLGGNRPIRVDLRIISLTNKDIQQLIRETQFREDLFFRIAQFNIEIPPLRKRPGDIIPLVNHFIEHFSTRLGKDIAGFSEKTLRILSGYSWPGNVRQLENLAHILTTIANPGEWIYPHLLDEGLLLQQPVTHDPAGGGSERESLVQIMETHKWKKSAAAKALGISRTALYNRLKRLNIKY